MEKKPQSVSFIERFFSIYCVLYSECSILIHRMSGGVCLAASDNAEITT